MKKVAVVILNWNTRKQLEQFLPSVIEHSPAAISRVVVADNGSNDGSVRFVAGHYPGVHIIQLDKNYGYTGGYMRALEQVNAQYYVLLNSDVEVSANWLEPVIQRMDSDPKIAACQPKILSYSNRESFEYAGAAGGFIDHLGYPFCRGRIFNALENDHQQYNVGGKIFWASGAAMFVRASVFHEAGGLDDDFFAHMEEIDLCWRFQNLGFSIEYVPESVVYHVGGGTLPNESPAKLFLNFRNNLYCMYKNLPEISLRPIIFRRMLLDGIAFLQYLVKGKFKFARAIPRAHLAYYRAIPELKRKRQELKSQWVEEKHASMYPHSIVVDFFIKGKKHFSELKWHAKL